MNSFGVHLNLDGAWDKGILDIEELDLMNWGPRLRYCALPADIEDFYGQVRDRLTPFVLLGSGDFHHLTALFIRRLSRPVTLVSFDNHPDWARRPRWSCGSWIRRALESGRVEQIVIWGCGNFELKFPHSLFADYAPVRSGRLQIYAWAERYDKATLRRYEAITQQNWKERFSDFCHRLAGKEVYVTIDLDCLTAEDAITNWENGLFTVSEIAGAITDLGKKAHVIAGDICGAYSPPSYARRMQHLLGRWDHPVVPRTDENIIRQTNRAALEALWPALTNEIKNDRDQ